MFMSDSLPPVGGRVMVSGEIPWETQYNQFMFWSIVVGLIVFVWLLYAVLRFRRGMVDESNLEKLEPGTFPKERDNLRLEAVWVVIPSILVAWLCLLSWTSMYDAWGNPPLMKKHSLLRSQRLSGTGHTLTLNHWSSKKRLMAFPILFM